MSTTIIDANLFEYLGAKPHLSCHSKEIAAETTYLLSQLIKSLPKVLSFNALDYCNKNAIESCPLFPQVDISDDFYKIFNHVERKDINSMEEEEKSVKTKKETYSIVAKVLI